VHPARKVCEVELSAGIVACVFGGCRTSDFGFNFNMSKRASGGRANQPNIPQVSVQTWKELLAAAEEFNRLAPWTWMHDSQVIGLVHPVSKEVLLGSIVGRLRSVFGLLLYRNAAGHRWLLNAILSEGKWGANDDSAFEQDAIKLEFVLKRELAKEDRAILTAANYSPSKGGRVWPQFQSIVPGAYPWHVMQPEAETLLFALPRIGVVARLARQKPALWKDHRDGEIALIPDFDPTADELRAEQIDWQPMIPPPEPQPAMVSLDEEEIAELSKLRQATGFHLELDVAYSPMAIADVDRPRFPKLALAVDRASGFIGGFRLGDFNDPDGAASLGKVLHQTLTQLGARPEMICVQRPRVAAMLRKVASRLGIPLVSNVELTELNTAKASIMAHLQGR
jgi:hypothetical protein